MDSQLEGHDLMFGDFGGLDPEEHDRIINILRGNKPQDGNKVEFPWDGETEEGLVGAVGGNNFSCDFGGKSWIDESAYEGSNYPDFSYDSGYPSFNNAYDQSDAYSDQHQSQDAGNAPTSKLQASLKPYERRNKKKRPADYYKAQDVGQDLSGHPDQKHSGVEFSFTREGAGDQGYRPELHSSMLPGRPQPPPGYTLLPKGAQYQQQGHMQSLGQSYMSGQNMMNTMPVQVNTCVAPGPGQPDNIQQNDVDDQLQEIVVMSSNNTHMPARAETYQNQDHERTNVLQFIDSAPKSKCDVNSNNYSNSYESVMAREYVAPSIDGSKSALANQGAQTDPEASTPVTPVDVSVKETPDVTFSSQSDSAAFNTNNTTIPESNTSSANTCASANIEQSDSNMDISPVSESQESVAMDATPQEGIVPVAAPEPVKAKPSSWAGLFKSAGSPASAVVSNYVPTGVAPAVTKTEADQRSEKEFSPQPVSAAEDSEAKHLGQMLSQMRISHASVSLQPRGLVNKGNWCYINGKTLQALAACPPFYNLLKKLPRYPALSRGPTSTPILDAMVEFVHEFQPMPRTTEKGPRNRGNRDINPGQPFEPTYMFRMLQTMASNPHFKLGRQEDAEEFLSCILDGMHEEMSAAVGLTQDPAGESEEETYTNGFCQVDGEPEEEGSLQGADDWEQVGPKKKSVLTRKTNFAQSPIADIFAGMIRSIVYKSTSKETATLEPFFTLQLDIQSEKVQSVKEALAGLVSVEQIRGYTCSTTNTEMEVGKKLSLEELPPVLILHLKCFVYNKDGGFQKLLKKVDYPVELEITKELLSPNAKNKLNLSQRSYKLFAVVYHHGKALNGGHYTTNVFHPGINGWVNLDDSTVRTVSSQQVLKYAPPRVPYLLYYRRLDSQQH